MMENSRSDQLGPFQDIWEAWNDADEEIRKKEFPHFRLAVLRQFVELREHLEADDREAAAREATDIISIALNLMRWLGYKPDEIADIARARAEKRMKGQAVSILVKYERDYGI